MRKELILVLLCIICTSFLSSLLSGYVHIESDKLLLDTVAGAVGAGNFSYWQLGHMGPLLVELTSLSGDADLYVSESIRPSFEVDKYNYSSVTCGPDLVSIPADFPRPLGIGVFGHWSHELSEYSIQVFLDTSESSLDSLEALEKAASFTGPEGESKRAKERPIARKGDDESKPRFLKLLSILDMIFEMFVL